MGSDANTVQAFLELFYGDEVSTDDRCAIWTKHNKRHAWCSSIKDAVAAAEKEKDRDTYFSVGLYPRGVTRRTQDNVSCIFGVWLDIDCGEKENGKRYFKDIEDALGWVYSSLSGQWSIITHSGRGVHVYLLFDEPFYITDEISRDTARLAVRSYYSWACSQTETDIDPVTDLSRIMRLPGTRNTASGQMAHLVDSCDARVSITELLERLPTVDLPAESSHVATLDGDVDIDLIKQRVALMIDADSNFALTWKRSRRFKDNSPSSYCLSLSNQLVAAGLSDSEVYATLLLWRQSQLDADDKPSEWYAATISKARAGQKTQVQKIELAQKLTAALLEDDEEKTAEVVAEIFGMPLSKIVRVVAPEHKGKKSTAKYRLEFASGTIEVDSTSSLMSQQYMRNKMFEDLGCLMRRMKAPQYDQTLEVLLSMMETENEAAEANDLFVLEQELSSYVAAKIEQCDVTNDLGEYRSGMLYKDDNDVLWFKVSSFKQKISSSGSMQVGMRSLAGMLRDLGSEPNQFSDKSRSRLWSVPEGV